MGQGLLEARGLGDVAQPPVDLAGGLLEEDVQVSGARAAAAPLHVGDGHERHGGPGAADAGALEELAGWLT